VDVDLGLRLSPGARGEPWVRGNEAAMAAFGKSWRRECPFLDEVRAPASRSDNSDMKIREGATMT
jgi:hypothetical protein